MPQYELDPYETSVSVGTSSVEVLTNLGPDKTRKGFIITNTSTGGQIVTLGFGKDAVAGSGAVLYPGGSYWEFTDPAWIVFQRRILAIASGASGTVAIQERIE